MRYTFGNTVIAVQTIDGFGKNPGLWIGTDNPNQMVKVASFGNEDKAKLFCKWFEYITGINRDRAEVEWDADNANR